MLKNMKKSGLSLVIISILSGCGAVSLQPPKSNIPKVFSSVTVLSKESLNLNPNWWLLFDDDTLNDLIVYALNHNTDLGIAVLNIKIAQNTLSLTQIDKRPTNSLSTNVGTDRNLKTGDKSDSNSIRYSFSYEVDLWNSLENAENAQEWALKASEQDKEVTKLALISSIISLYYKSIYLNETINMAEQSVEYSKKLLSITETKVRVGKLSGLELAQARTSLIEQEYALDNYKQNSFENINALKALLNLNPSDKLPNGLTIPEKMPNRVFKKIKSDIPSNILKNRPDVLAAQMRIQQAFYNVKNKESDFYPKLSITGSLGNTTTELLKFINNPIGSLAASIQFPILDYKKNKENLRISEHRYNIYALEYQKTLVKAMEEVENRLSFYYYNKDNYEKIDEVFKETQKIRQIYDVRYKSGVAALQVLLDAQEKERRAYLNKLSHIYDLINSESQVYQSLGGKYQ